MAKQGFTYRRIKSKWHQLNAVIAGKHCTFWADSREAVFDKAFIHHRRAFGYPKEHVALWSLCAKAHDRERFDAIAEEERDAALGFTDGRAA